MEPILPLKAALAAAGFKLKLILVDPMMCVDIDTVILYPLKQANNTANAHAIGPHPIRGRSWY